jgi:NADH-quinone oxidoreductase subunit J
MGFPLFTALAVVHHASALHVVLQENPLNSALSLVVTLSILAVFFLFLDAELLAALQILVYAGAIMVLFLFVIMLLNLSKPTGEKLRGFWVVTSVAGSALFVLELLLLLQEGWPGRNGDSPAPPGFGTVREVGKALFTDFLLPFEITSLLLLAALVGALFLGRKERQL